MLNQEEGYPVSAGCDLLGLSPSTYYYQPVRSDESELEASIDKIAGQYPTYGTRRVLPTKCRSIASESIA